tara:strand:- start:2452 stop:2703 length:252 start_codon:yes stop_codon:yes gene_type:complete
MRRRKQAPVSELRLSPLRAQYDYSQSSSPPQRTSPPKRPSSPPEGLTLSPVSPMRRAPASSVPSASKVNLRKMVDQEGVYGGA